MLNKKLISCLARIFVLFCVCSVCFQGLNVLANRKPEFTHNLGGMPISCSIYGDQASLNGIKGGDSLQKVRAILGEPTSVSKNKMLTYYYRGLTIKFVDFGGSGKTVVYDMEGTKQGEVSTLDGVKPGMPESALSEIYGTADVVRVEKVVAPKLSGEQNEKYRKRLDKTIYTYYANPCLTMSFTVKEGIISSINIHLTD